jgi:hypothetical protein
MAASVSSRRINAEAVELRNAFSNSIVVASHQEAIHHGAWDLLTYWHAGGTRSEWCEREIAQIAPFACHVP